MSKAWFSLLLCLPLAGQADERILAYASDILVRGDGIIEVSETITVRAEGRQIRRGIYRDYPTRYRDRFGNAVQADYTPLSVLRDGRPEAFHSETVGNGVRTYFGSANVFLEPGVYTYTYRYDAGRMLGFFEDHDELYWNVTGFGWEFPIDRAAATVRFGFEVGAEDLDVDAWTGRTGSREQDFTATTTGGVARFETTRPLASREGLTIVVSWPKGHVSEPGPGQRTLWLLADNVGLVIALGGFWLMLLYYLPVWYRYGRDPAPGVTFTRYEPPQGLSPASLRYIRRMGYDNKTFTAAVVNLAVKGRLTIEQDGEAFALVRNDAPAAAPPLARGERELLEALFADRQRVPMDDEYHEIFSAARSAHRTSLRADYRNRMFRTNGLMTLPAVLVFLATLLLTFAGDGDPGLFAKGVLVLMVGTMALFAWLMKQPTGVGRRVLDEVDGFREYLEIAEKDELNLRNPPEKTPELFERYLPFALALGVEQQWAERFSRLFAGLQAADGSSYHPAWYSGAWNSHDVGSNTASLSGGLNAAISSSMSPPGSSSGGGGGGSAGGGGGGGGGGGW